MESKVLSVKKLNGKALSRLLNIIPRKYQNKAEVLFDCIYNFIYLELYDVVVKIKRTKKHLIVIPHANVAIDINSCSLRDFFEMGDFLKTINSANTDFFEELDSDIDSWNSLSRNFAKLFPVDMNVDETETFEYRSINDIVKLGRSYPMISSYLIEKLTDEAYYKKVGVLDQKGSCILNSRKELLSLFEIQDEALKDEWGFDNEKENPFILKGDKIDLCIYSSNSEVIAFSPKKTFFRAIVQTDLNELDEVEDGQLRYIFETFRWENIFGISLDGEYVFRNKKKFYSFDKEAYFPLYFYGIYKYCKKQSLKEGLFVWKLVNTKVNVPLPKEEFNQADDF